MKDIEGAENSEIDWTNEHADAFMAAMNDDFNTPEAIAVLFELASIVNKTQSVTSASLLKSLGGILGLLQQIPQAYLQNSPAETAAAVISPEEIEQLIQQRLEARKAGRYTEADAIRQNLLNSGIILEDGPQGTTWRRN